MARSRKRRKRRPKPDPARRAPSGAGAAEAQVAAAGRPGGRGASAKPAPPWGSFPLSELVVLLGIVFLVGGFFAGPPKGPVMIGAGIVLASLAGLELAIREHFAGYRSHTLLLAGAIGVGAMIALFAAQAPVSPTLRVAIGVALFGLAAWWFAIGFRRRSGGAIFKVR